MRPSTTVVLALALATAPLAAQNQNAIISSSGASYTLRPGDLVRITVWGQEEYSGQFQVDEEGRIQYPVLGAIETRNRTVGDLRETIRSGLLEIFNRPFVTITPLFRIAVLGEVRAPGLLTVDPTLSVLDVVALAGGANPDGNLNKLRLLRDGRAVQPSRGAGGLFGQSLQDIGIRSGDQILVPRQALTAAEWQIIIGLAQVGLSIAILANTF